MKSVIFIISIISLNTPVSIRADDVDEASVNYYLELIENRTREAQNYKFPTDARMYEAQNKIPKGTNLIVLALNR